MTKKNISTSEKKKNDVPNINIERKIGSTTYMVTAHFNSEAKGDIVEKVKKLITKQ